MKDNRNPRVAGSWQLVPASFFVCLPIGTRVVVEYEGRGTIEGVSCNNGKHYSSAHNGTTTKWASDYDVRIRQDGQVVSCAPSQIYAYMQYIQG